MDFDEILTTLLADERIKPIPILYVIEIVMVLDDMDLFKEVHYE